MIAVSPNAARSSSKCRPFCTAPPNNGSASHVSMTAKLLVRPCWCDRPVPRSADGFDDLSPVELPPLDDPEPDVLRGHVCRCGCQHPTRRQRRPALMVRQLGVVGGNRPQRAALVQPTHHQPDGYMTVPQRLAFGCGDPAADVDQ